MSAAVERLIAAAGWFGRNDLATAHLDPRGVIVERDAITIDHELATLPAPFMIGRNSYHMGGVLAPWTVIGRYCSLSRSVDIGVALAVEPTATPDRPPDPPDAAQGARPAERPITVIGCDVWMGANSCVVEGVRVGHGAVIGGHSVITEDVAPYAIVGGNPARVIRNRFPPELVERLLASRWWTLPPDLVGRLPKHDLEASLRIAEGYGRRT